MVQGAPEVTVRIGQGLDVHAFTAGDHVMLGGVRIPCQQGLAAHSDGDVLLHAVCDALLGAAALGDIGHHFPDYDPALAGIDSRELLRRTARLIRERGFGVGNVDATVMAQRPRLAPHIDSMRRCIAGDLDVDPDRVSVKATTTEALGFIGRGEGIAAQAVVLLH